MTLKCHSFILFMFIIELNKNAKKLNFSFQKELNLSRYNIQRYNNIQSKNNSLRKQQSFFATSLSGVSREGRLRFTAENSILMKKICHASGHER